MNINSYIGAWEEQIMEMLMDFNYRKIERKKLNKNKTSAKARNFKKNMNKAFKRLINIWTSTKKVMGIAKRIRNSTKKFILNRKKWYKQM